MAATAAKQLEDLTECPICSQTYIDPRVLPCIHTYCLKCIDKWGKDKVVRGKLACPLCRKEIDIPEGGFVNLPKNFFVEKLMDVRKLTGVLESQNKTLCDVCKEESETIESAATVYCVDCRQNMCEPCLLYHRKFKTHRQHQVVELSNKQVIGDILLKFPENVCDKHPDKNLEIYCFECKFATCMMCYITSHNAHKCSDIKVVADEMRNGVKADVDGVERIASECREELQKLSKEMESFGLKATKVEMEIKLRAKELRQLVDDYEVKLLEELKVGRKQQEKKLENLRHELEGRLVMMGSFVRYSDELRSRGTACDVARAASSLRDRAKELMEFDVSEELGVETVSTDVKFMPGLKKDEMECMFGELQIMSPEDIDSGNFNLSSNPLHVIPSTGTAVCGVTSLDDELFVMRENSQQISVYDCSTFTLQRHLQVPGYTACNSSLAACKANRCIYVSYRNLNKVVKIKLSASDAITSWPVGATPYGLSVNDTRNILIACAGVVKIEEYDTNGALIREISLQSPIQYPINVIQLQKNQFGITHGGSLQRFCVIGLDGKATKIHGSSCGSGDGLLTSPYGLTIRHKCGTVFIADNANNRIKMLNPSTFSATVTLSATVLAVDGGLTCPFCLHYDNARGRLYIGESSGNMRLLVLGKGK